MSLKKVAASMHVEALKKGRAFRRLRGGLCLTLYYRTSPKDDIVLKLTRPNVQPSETEIKVCVMNFFGNCTTTNCVRKGYAVYLGIARSSFYGKAA
jgi:hypothetical protein